MSKEMIISSSPHETKIALTEDGQVVEVYIEREREVGLVGSIYKGRVTRVLPGMQSAFVNVGLERDAFLYVSDFSENLEGFDHAPTSEEEQAPERESSAPSSRRRRSRRPRRRRSRPSAAGDTASSEPTETGSKPGSADEAEVSAGTDKPESGGKESTETPLEPPMPTEGEAEDETGFASRRGGEEASAPAEKPTGNADGTGELELALPEKNIPRLGRSHRSRRRGGRGRRGGRSRGPLGPRSAGEPPQERSQPVVLPGESIAAFNRLVSETATTSSPTDEGDEQTPRLPPDEDPQSATNPPWDSPEAETGEELSSREEQAGLQQSPEETSNGSDTLDADELDEPESPEVSPTVVEEPQQDVTASPAETTEEGPADISTRNDNEDDSEKVQDTELPSETKLEEYPPETISADTRDQLDETLAELERYRKYQDEVGLPPSLQERTAGGVLWQDDETEQNRGEAEDTEAEPETGEIDNGTEGTSTVTEQPETAQPQAPAGKPKRGRRRVRRTTGGRGQRGRRHPSRKPVPARTMRRRQFSARPSQGQPAIAELLRPGQDLIIQIAKEQIGQKGARITSHVTLPGRYLVYMPTINHIGVSRKIGTAEERARLRRALLQMKGEASGGFVVRTAAAGCTQEELKQDVEYLVRLWGEIREQFERKQPPALLHQDLDLVQRLMRDLLTPAYDNVWIDNEEEYARVTEFVSKFLPRLASKVKLYTREEPIFEEMGVQQEIDRALRPKVWLKSGGYIVINQTEALVAIDINTGKFVGKGSTRLEDTIVKTNLEAVREIVRQVRLRDLGGIIVIDFIDMEDRRNRYKVMRALEEALQIDRQPSKILAFNEFGLVAITRKRSKQSLERILCQPCPYCTGTGTLKSIQTLCIEIQNEARKMAMEIDAPELTVRANPEIVSALKGEAGKLIRELEEEFSKNIILQPDNSLHFEHYNIY